MPYVILMAGAKRLLSEDNAGDQGRAARIR